VLVAAFGVAEGTAAEEGEGKLVGFERFREVVARAEADGFDGFFDAAERGHDNDAGVFGETFFAEKFDALAVGEVQVEEGKIEVDAGEQAAGFGE
jgi:hypothetical protein